MSIPRSSAWTSFAAVILLGASGCGGGGGGGDPTCTPVDDGNQCTADLCEAGDPVNPPRLPGTPCSQSGGNACDGLGSCVDHCFDGAQDADEPDVDCGGSSCGPCAGGQGCFVNADCQSLVCAGTVCATPGCGDGVTHPGESCDDGNGVDGDGCDSNCTFTGCGNGVVTGTESCDDGNGSNGDGCDNNCTPSSCGNGLTGGTEACDDGNGVDGDGCDSNCTFTSCGNGVITAGEGCDDGNPGGTDGCSGACQVESGFQCSGVPSSCLPWESACADGADNDADGLTDAADPNCAVPAAFVPCGATERLHVFNGTSLPDAIPDGTGGSLSRTIAVTGVGAVARVAAIVSIAHTFDADVDLFLTPPPGGEIELSTDNGGSGDDFTNTVFDAYCAVPITSAAPPFNGCFQPEGSLIGPAGGSASGSWTLRAADDTVSDAGTLTSWKLAICAVTGCGDGQVGGLEVCDDGNRIDGDGCDANCKPTACGNGAVTAGEGCDDGNTTGSDGCSVTCQLEGTHLCWGSPSVCSRTEMVCSDGADNDGDGLTDAADGDCTVPGYFPACGGGQELYVFTSPFWNVEIPGATGAVSWVDVPIGGVIARAALQFRIIHPWDEDVDLFLRPPGGPELEGTTDNGGGGDDYWDTLLDSSCATPITAGAAPFTGCYQPEGSFAPLAGTSPAGRWRLRVADDFPMLDTGSISFWRLIFCVTP